MLAIANRYEGRMWGVLVINIKRDHSNAYFNEEDVEKLVVDGQSAIRVLLHTPGDEADKKDQAYYLFVANHPKGGTVVIIALADRWPEELLEEVDGLAASLSLSLVKEALEFRSAAYTCYS